MKPKTKNTQLDRKDEILRRLRCTEGHLGGIVRMVEAERPNPAILAQLGAVKGALEKVTLSLLQQQIYGMFSAQEMMKDNEDLDALLEDVAELMLALRLRYAVSQRRIGIGPRHANVLPD
ncbi:MAG: transcriptional regulator [Anaerolineales bacterium]|nr:MAG: transcriptional regulator [Anaerolineales bacterium]